ncbi:MAG: DUF4190 domain-containing protein [Tepidisphaeraceae bacterium]
MSQVPPPMSAPPMGYQTPPPAKPQGMAIGALVCGILSIVLSCLWFVSIPLALVAIILGVIGKGKAARGEAGGEGMAKTGMILGIVGIALGILLIVIGLATKSVLEKKGAEWQQQLEQKANEMEQAAEEAERSTPTTSPTAP